MQLVTGVHDLQASAGPLWSRYLPLTHCVHCESPWLVQVTAEVQKGISVQNAHVSATPSRRYVPDSQFVHCELPALVHVARDVQKSMLVHGRHALAPFTDVR